MIYLESMFSGDGEYELDAKRRIAAGNRVTGALAALMRLMIDRWDRPYIMQCWYQLCHVVVKRG